MSQKKHERKPNARLDGKVMSPTDEPRRRPMHFAMPLLKTAALGIAAAWAIGLQAMEHTIVTDRYGQSVDYSFPTWTMTDHTPTDIMDYQFHTFSVITTNVASWVKNLRVDDVPRQTLKIPYDGGSLSVTFAIHAEIDENYTDKERSCSVIIQDQMVSGTHHVTGSPSETVSYITWRCTFHQAAASAATKQTMTVNGQTYHYETQESHGFTWTYEIKGGAAEIVKYTDTGKTTRAISPDPKTNDVVVIPSYLGGCPVKSIGDGAFTHCTTLTNVTIPDSVTNIARCAFLQCYALTSVALPDGVTEIGEYAFTDCRALTSVTIPNSVTNIGEYAFNGCNMLSSVSVPDGMKSIGPSAFAGCGMKNVTIPNSVTNIDTRAFSGCSSLTNVIIPGSVTSIGEYAFYWCDSLTRVTIPDSVSNIGEMAFHSCDNLRHVTIGDGATSIGMKAFGLCSSLENVAMGNGAVSIGDYAFYWCENLKKVVMGAGVTNIGDSAFSHCGSLESIVIPSSLAHIGNSPFAECTGVRTLTIELDLEKHSLDKVFLSSFRESLEDVVFKGDVETIYDFMFNDFKALRKVTMPDGVVKIGNYAFYNCISLTNAIIPNSVVSVGDNAFRGCTMLTDVVIGNSVTNIGSGAFYACGSLNVTMSDGIMSIGDCWFGSSSINSVTIPDSVTKIGDSAFHYCDALTSVTIPSCVTSIGQGAFYCCAALTNVIFKGDAPTIGLSSFADVASTCVVEVPQGSTGWGVNIPGTWNGLRIKYSAKEVVEPETYAITLKSVSTKYGTVSGGGTYAAGAKATLKAKAKSGYVFAGWFTDKACTKPLNPKGYDNRKATVKYAMPAKNTTVYAKFITKSAAKKSLKFSSGTKKLATTAKAATAGKTFALALGISSASLPTVTAKGLPKGFAIDKTTGEISGKGTVPGAYTATITVKDAAGNKITQKIKLTVSVPSWAKGSLYGYAVFESKSSSVRQKSCSVEDEVSGGTLKFTVGKTGKVSGKVLYNGKWHSFTSSLASCNSWRATFKPTIKVGSASFKYGTVSLEASDDWGIPITMASNSEFTFSAQKKPELVKKGKPLASLIGKTFTFTRKDKNSGLTKKNDKLTVKLGSGDTVTVSGTVDGRKLTAVSWPALLSYADMESETEYYELYVNIFDVAQTYRNTLYIGATVGPGGTAATATFPEF